jgi:translation initiation factor IF-3
MNKNKKEENKLNINFQIKSPQVKLVGDNVTMGIYSIREAIRISEELELDLVEIGPTQSPPICKIMDYQKFLYDKKKNEKKSDKVETKEVRFRPVTDDNDLNVKINSSRKFLEKGNRVKAYVYFKGRENMYKNKGAEILKKYIEALEDCSSAESDLKFEGNKIIVFLKPKKK